MNKLCGVKLSQSMQQHIETVSKKYQFKGETPNIDGPLYLNGKPYWIIYYIKKGLFKKKRGAALIVLDAKGEIVKNWKTYRKVAITYLMPKLSEKFVELYLNEINEINEISVFFKNSQESIHEFNIDELIKKAKSHEVNELVDCLASFKTQLMEFEESAVEIVNIMEKTKEIVKELLTKNEYTILRDFLRNFALKEKKMLKELRRNISEQAYTVFDLVNVIRETGMRKEESKKLIESINKYASDVRQIEKRIDDIMKNRKLISYMYKERKTKVKKFYEEMLKRVE